jgi:hypothetical protein
LVDFPHGQAGEGRKTIWSRVKSSAQIHHCLNFVPGGNELLVDVALSAQHPAPDAGVALFDQTDDPVPHPARPQEADKYHRSEWQQASSQAIVDDALRLGKILLDRHDRHRHDPGSRGCFGHVVILGQNSGVAVAFSRLLQPGTAETMKEFRRVVIRAEAIGREIAFAIVQPGLFPVFRAARI